MAHRVPWTLTAILLVGWSVALACAAQACDVPVFRYALERWPSVPYEVVALHRGPLADEERNIAKRLGGPATANVRVRLGDLAAQSNASLERLWEEAGRPKLPCMILRYPREQGIERPAWWGRLTADNAKALVDSPARREIARRILEGHSAVWVLLESGDAKRDAAARSLLATRLKRAEQTVELPAGLADVPQDGTETSEVVAPPLQVRFSLLAISRADPAESVFAEMLLRSEAGLAQYASQPMVFPVYGRGRALYALVGKGITEENVQEACQFLVGPCSCIAKAENPGTDLLMAVDWEAGLAGSAVNAVEPQPLVGLATLAEAAETASASARTPEAFALAPDTPAAAPDASKPTPDVCAATPEDPEAEAKTSAPTLETRAGVEADAEPASPQASGGLLRNTLIALALIVVIAALLVIRIATQPRKERP